MSLGVPAAVVAAFLLLRSPTPPVEAGLAYASSTTTIPVSTTGSLMRVETTTSIPSARLTVVLTVHVAGRVVHPSVYELPIGARVIDAVEMAGGAASFANLDAVNLAAPIEDGQQVYIPAYGEAPHTVVGDSNASSSSLKFEPVNINTADESALDALPGIGPATARAIVAYRDEHGPFAAVSSLEDVPGIGPSKVANLDGLVTV